MSRRLILAALAVAGVLLADSKAGSKPANYTNIPLWDAGQVPMAKGTGPLDVPFLTVFLPPEGKRNGGSVVVAPGGSNIMLMYGAEGTDPAEVYNDWGVTAFVLTYRLSPHYNEAARVADGKRAIQMVRAHAAEFRLDPAKESALVAHLRAAELYSSAPPKAGVFTPPVDFPAHERCVEVGIDVGRGDAGAVVLGADLTHEYVSENADYRS